MLRMIPIHDIKLMHDACLRMHLYASVNSYMHITGMMLIYILPVPGFNMYVYTYAMISALAAPKSARCGRSPGCKCTLTYSMAHLSCFSLRVSGVQGEWFTGMSVRGEVERRVR